MNSRKAVLIGIVCFAGAMPVMAVENAVGPSLPGAWVMPQGGVVSTTPGFTFTVMPIGYWGRISGGGLSPIGGQLAANVSANLSSNFLIPQFVYKTENHEGELFFLVLRAG